MALLCAPGGVRGEVSASPSGTLAANYLRYLLLNHVGAQGADLIAQAPAGLQSDLRTRLDGWRGSFQETIRVDLEQGLGAEARPRFEAFIAAFTQAEQAKDLTYLEQLGSDVGWPGPAAAGFEAFRRWGIQQWVAVEMQAGVDFLGEMAAQVDAAARQSAAPPPPPRPVNPLRDAESAAPPLESGEVSNGAPLQSFSGRREQRREKALEQAQAGMDQVAAEREAWEQEYASEVEAKAQAEAEAMKSQAERLAATDEEALEQRKNSLKSKVVSVLAGVASSTVSGFTGAVGGRAADEAVHAIFDDK
ncbi:MAG TPA: hypothetical protein DCM68_04985 [Verrucomicrobia bacterium]|nr:hypothetical protein [Verrucomicrobiota bacterium]